MAESIYSWSPYIALALGLLSALGAFRSWQTWFTLTGLAMLLQVIGWEVVFVASHVAKQGWDADWQVALSLGPTVLPAVLRTLGTVLFLMLGSVRTPWRRSARYLTRLW